MNDLHILVVNINNLDYTKNCIADLMMQLDHDFDLTIIDNGSTENGTREYMDMLAINGVTVIIHNQPVSLVKIWNDFYKNTQNKFLCYLNNDVRLSCNYVSSIKKVFEKESTVGIVCHATNNPKYSEVKELEYVVLFENMRQGWEFTIKRDAYCLIPEVFHTFCGDDYIYAKLYEKGFKAAMILSSPVIHFLGKSQYPGISDVYNKDVENFKKMGFKTFLWSGYSIGKPHLMPISMIKNGLIPILTINVVTYERYDELMKCIEMYQAQTDPRFILDIWQDGPDDKKRNMLKDIVNPRIKYNENPERRNLYGHDMRDKSIANCTTELWCTTNDDNWVNPLFVERVLSDYQDYDMTKISVAMANLPIAPIINVMKMIQDGHYNPAEYSKYMTVLDINNDSLGQVDACGFVVKTELIKQFGWKNMEFHGDHLVFSKVLQNAKSVRRLNEVLQVHR